MIIAIDVRMLESSGIGTYIENIVVRLVVLRPSWKFFLLGKKKMIRKYPLLDAPNVIIIECHSPIYSIQEQWELVRKIPKVADFFWAPHYNIPLGYLGRTLVTIHDVLPLAHPEYFYGIHKRLYALGMFQAAASKAYIVLTVSNFTSKEIKRHLRINGDKIKVVHCGVDEKWYQTSSCMDRHKGKPYFLYVGNIKPHKNIYRMIIAFKSIMDRIDADLVIVGRKDGFITSGMAELSKVIQSLGDRVKFTGYVSEKKLMQYYVCANALIFPSLYEGFGLPVLEAMACGCPVLSSNTASMPEVGGDAVVYCNPYDESDLADKMLYMSKQKFDRNALIGQARSFSWDVAAEKIGEILANNK